MNKLNDAKGTNDDIDYLLAEYGLVASIAYQQGWLLYESDIPSEYDKIAAEMGYSSRSQLEERDELIYGKRYLIDKTFISKAANYIYGKANIIWD